MASPAGASLPGNREIPQAPEGIASDRPGNEPPTRPSPLKDSCPPDHPPSTGFVTPSPARLPARPAVRWGIPRSPPSSPPILGPGPTSDATNPVLNGTASFCQTTPHFPIHHRPPQTHRDFLHLQRSFTEVFFGGAAPKRLSSFQRQVRVQRGETPSRPRPRNGRSALPREFLQYHQSHPLQNRILPSEFGTVFCYRLEKKWRDAGACRKEGGEESESWGAGQRAECARRRSPTAGLHATVGKTGPSDSRTLPDPLRSRNGFLSPILEKVAKKWGACGKGAA